MIRRLKNLIIAIIFVCAATCVVNAGEYFYFTGNGLNNNGFQQGCQEIYYVKYDNLLSSRSYGQVTLSFYLDPSKFLYETGTYDKVGASRLFTISNQNLLYPGETNVITWDNNWRRGYTTIQKKSNGVLSLAGEIGYFNFKPVYSPNLYSGNFIFVYESEGANTVGWKYGQYNFIQQDPNDQLNNLTGTIEVKREPCTIDENSPIIESSTYVNGSTGVKNNGLSFTIDDSMANGNTPYYYNVNGIWTGNGGTNTINGWTINDQTGVNFSSVVVTVSGNNQLKVFTGNQNLTGTSLGKTWGRTDRGYSVNIDSGKLFDFGVEEKITIRILGEDRLHNSTSTVVEFNQFEPPYLDNKSPQTTEPITPLNSAIQFDGHDKWAGVDSGRLTVILSCSEGCLEPFSKTYDVSYFKEGTHGSFIQKIEGEEGTGNAAGYRYNLVPDVDLPAGGTITVTVGLYDLKGNLANNSRSWTFKTRPSCSELQCCTATEILTGGETGITYTGDILVISGGNNVEVSIQTGYIYSELLSGDFLVINCNYVGLILFKGTPENNPTEVASVPYNRLVFSGSNNLVKGVLSGNVLTLKYYVQDTNVEIDSPSEGTRLSGGYLVDENNEYTTTGVLSWHLADDTDSSQWLSGYDFVVYSGDVFGTDEVMSGRVTSTGITREFTGSKYVRGVRAVDNQGNTGEWATGSFKIKYKLDNASLMLNNPENNYISLGTTSIDFDWTLNGVGDGVGDIKYDLYVYSGVSADDNTDWGTPQLSNLDTTTGNVVLENGENYWWKVVVRDGYGHEISGYTGTFKVQVETKISRLKIQPLNISGTVASRDTDGTYLADNMFMEWSGNQDDIEGSGNLVEFILEIYSGGVCNNGNLIWSGSTGINVTRMLIPQNVIELEQGEYCWQIKAIDDSNNYSSNSGLSFTVANPYCTRQVSNLSLTSPTPINNAQLYTSGVTLSWSANWDSCLSLTSGYRVELYTGDEGTIIENNGNRIFSVTGDFTSTGLILSGGKYRWRVQMIDDVEGEWKTGSFEIVALLDPGHIVDTHFELVLVTPTSGSTFNTGNVGFEWYATGQGAGTLTYTLSVYTGVMDDINNSTLITGISAGSATGLNVDLGNGTYWWKVKVEDNYNNSGIASTGYFDVSLEQTYLVKVDLGRAENTQKSLGLIAFYTGGMSNQAPVHTGIVVMGTGGTGLYLIGNLSGEYDVVYKSWQHLASYLTGVIIGPTMTEYVLDFSSGSGLSPTKQQIEGDFDQNGVVEGADLTVILGQSSCNAKGNAVPTTSSNILCDADGNGEVATYDAGQTLKYMSVDYNVDVYGNKSYTGYTKMMWSSYLQDYLSLLGF